MDSVLDDVTQAWRGQILVHVNDSVWQGSTCTVSWFVKLQVLNKCNVSVIHRIAAPHEARTRAC